MEKPWLTEPNAVDFEAEGLPCAMRRNSFGVWCGYVGLGPDHPLYGLPTNHPLKLPKQWFEHRRVDQSVGPIDLFIHLIGSDKPLTEACAIALAFVVHGGVSFAGHLKDLPDDQWWFGFDCGHAGDYSPYMERFADDHLPPELREQMKRLKARVFPDVYRDQAYVVAECQSLAAQLVAVEKLLAPVKPVLVQPHTPR